MCVGGWGGGDVGREGFNVCVCVYVVEADTLRFVGVVNALSTTENGILKRRIVLQRKRERHTHTIHTSTEMKLAAANRTGSDTENIAML